MKKDVLLSKRVKAIIASAMALTMAVPSAVMLSQSTEVEAADLPKPIAEYTFDSESEEITLVDNEVKPEIVADDERQSNVLVLKNHVETEVTREGVDATGDAIVITDKEYVFSEATVKNPFIGQDLAEEPDLTGKAAPVWNKGVTISYWQKASSTDSSVLSFSNTRENVRHVDSQVKRLMFEMYKANPDNPVFSLGEPTELDVPTSSRSRKWKGLKYTLDGVGTGKCTVLDKCGIYVGFNPDCTTDYCYMEPVLDDAGEEIVSYVLKRIQYTYVESDWWEIGAPKVDYGTAKGGLQLNSSGAWGFLECGNDTELYREGKYLETRSLASRNHVAAHTYIPDAATKEDIYQDASPVKDPGKWHYITRVIKNDSISTYIDGQLKDEQLYTDKAAEASVDAGQKFNVGWGYNSEISSIMSASYGKSMYTNGDALYVLSEAYPKNEAPDGLGIRGVLGYNGNVVGITMLEMLMNEGTTLSFGGQTSSIKDVMGYVTGTSSDTAIDDVKFFNVPLDSAQVSQLYKQAQGGSSVDIAYGDLDGVGGIDLKDAQLALQAALRVITLTPEQQERADVDGTPGIDLSDALLILQRALRVINSFPVEN